MQKNSLRIEVIQAGDGLLLDSMGRILSDFGFTIQKTSDKISGPEYISSPSLDVGKTLLEHGLLSSHNEKQLQKARGLLLHQDFPTLEKTVDLIASKHPHLNIVVAHRFTPSKAGHNQLKQSHDANIQSLASVLSEFGQTDNPTDNTPQYPSVIATLVAANSGAILLATHLYDSNSQATPTKAKVLRISALHASMYLNTFNLNSHLTGMIKASRGKNLLDGAAPFYRIYRTRDHFITVGNIEVKFFSEMVAAMRLSEELASYLLSNQMNEQEWPHMTKLLQEEFAKRTTDEWIKMFSQADTCVSRVQNLPLPHLNEPWPKLSRHNLLRSKL